MPVGAAQTVDQNNRHTRADLPESVVRKTSGPPPEITQDRTQTKDTHQSQDRH